MSGKKPVSCCREQLTGSASGHRVNMSCFPAAMPLVISARLSGTLSSYRLSAGIVADIFVQGRDGGQFKVK